MKIDQLAKIVNLLLAEGHGNEYVEAYHDTLCLMPPQDLDEELAEKLSDLGVTMSEDYGWHVST